MKTKTFKSQIKTWSETTSIHGLPNLSRSRSGVARAVWTLLFTLACSYSVYLISQSFAAYFAYNVVSTVSIVKRQQIEFPTITICNLNAFDLTTSPHMYQQYSGLILKLVNESFANAQDLSFYYEGAQNYFNSLPYIFNKTQAQVTALGYTIKDMLMSCQFNARRCNHTDFTLLPTLQYGNCYQFNTKSMRRTKNGGPKYGFKFELFVGEATLDYQVVKSSGIRVYVHNVSMEPVIANEGIYVSTGTETDIVISQTSYNRLDTHTHNCIQTTTSLTEFDSDYYRRTIRTYGVYSQKYCFLICYNDYIVLNCNCSSVEFFRHDDSRGMTNIDDARCLNYKSGEFYSNDSLMNACYASCPQECNTTEYGLQVSFADYPTEFYASLVKAFFVHHRDRYPSRFFNFGSRAELKRSALAVNIYYRDTSFMLIEDSLAKTVEQLIADVGGLLGLWIGASLLSIVEVFELALELVKMIVNNNKKVNNVHELGRTS